MQQRNLVNVTSDETKEIPSNSITPLNPLRKESDLEIALRQLQSIQEGIQFLDHFFNDVMSQNRKRNNIIVWALLLGGLGAAIHGSAVLNDEDGNLLNVIEVAIGSVLSFAMSCLLCEINNKTTALEACQFNSLDFETQNKLYQLADDALVIINEEKSLNDLLENFHLRKYEIQSSHAYNQYINAQREQIINEKKALRNTQSNPPPTILNNSFFNQNNHQTIAEAINKSTLYNFKT